MNDMTPEFIYYELTRVSICLTTTLCILLFFIHPPRRESMRGYRITRGAVISAFLLVTVFNLIEILVKGKTHEENLIIMNTLIISSIQIFLFGTTIITMLNSNFYSIPLVFKELMPSILLSFTGFLIYPYASQGLLQGYFFIFSLYFGFQIVHYTFLYQRIKKKTVRMLDNFFSEETSKRLQWTGVAFVGLTGGGILSLLSLFLNMHFVVFFTVFYNAFYIFFTIHYLNYVNLFLYMEPALEPFKTVPLPKNLERSYKQLEAAIDRWEEEKLFTETGITIEQVSSKLNSNRTYLSNHMNVYRKMTFKEWINNLRIEEAKSLMKKNPDMPVSQIGVLVGIPDKSNFGRQFNRVTGSRPQAWRKNQK
jgi:AraC-like DNA-binding protein